MDDDAQLSQEELDRFEYLKGLTYQEREAIFRPGDGAGADAIAQGRSDKALFDKVSDALKDFSMVDGRFIMENVRDNKILGDNDRTVFNARLKYGQRGDVPIERYYMTHEKGFRDSICSGKMDGEQLMSFNDYYTMGFDTNNPALFYAECNDGVHQNNYDIVYEHLKKFFADMSTGQLSTFKTGSLDKFNKALNEIARMRAVRNGEEADINSYAERVTYTDERGNEKEVFVNTELKGWLDTQVKALSKGSAVSMRSNMAPLAKLMLGVKDRPDNEDLNDDGPQQQ